MQEGARARADSGTRTAGDRNQRWGDVGFNKMGYGLSEDIVASEHVPPKALPREVCRPCGDLVYLSGTRQTVTREDDRASAETGVRRAVRWGSRAVKLAEPDFDSRRIPARRTHARSWQFLRTMVPAT